ncbi:3',5'-cyclic adenosine monophosphate phosphodiesterase CpdA [Paenibacillus sp. CECT 9249]|uniref:metallophosphoesterase family protein n=1 Tax=Paenibacillus sp. CECT 9249 TaxID=2845385 RepID=UPI001E2AAD76|nr:metallophosphoesterase family protein [Paenibacillus sp. CECT 9249]CAH0117888.1 3',5'-cyclic adenosine monophosphate phosphodiesterase CpdA [Paenibacillus sp. CECT 9249]
MKHAFTFRESGTFTIAQFTDVHWNDWGEPGLNSEEENARSLALMQLVLREERPDLVVFSGDVISAGRCRDPRESFRAAVSAVEESRTPWAVVFGNHDTEAQITRQELMEVAAGFEYAVAEPGPAAVSGVGNYILHVRDGEGNVGAALYFFDSGNLSALSHVEGYDWIRRDQIGWYERESRHLTNVNGGRPLPALAFLHIPLPEYREVWESQTCYGHKYEEVCCPPVNSGLFAAMVEMGDVMGTFVGHDHINDYTGTLHGIRLCYGRATGFNTYGREGFPRGARMIQMKEGERDFDTWLRLEDGSTVTKQPEHRPCR